MIPKAVGAVFLHIVIAFAIASKLLFIPIGVNNSHDADSLVQSEVASNAVPAAGAAELDHVHDDERAEQQSPHTHQHSASDHSHDTPGTPPVFSVALPDIRVIPDSPYEVSGSASVVFGLDRPPRVDVRA